MKEKRNKQASINNSKESIKDVILNNTQKKGVGILQTDEEWNEELQINPYHEHERKFRESVHERIKNHKRKEIPGLGKLIRFHVMPKGEQALLFVLDIEHGNGERKKYVLKTYKEKKRTEIEEGASKKRIEQGANVIEVLQKSFMDIQGEQIPYLILPFIEQNPEDRNIEAREPGERKAYYKQLGENLAKMHKVKGTGLGHIQGMADLSGEDKELIYKEEIMGVSIRDCMIGKGVFSQNEMDTLIKKACDIIHNDFKQGEQPTLIHHDINLGNIFIKKSPKFEIMIFDLDAELSHPMEDLVLPSMDAGYQEKEFTTSYTDHGGTYNEDVINAYRFLLCIRRGTRAYYRAENMCKNEKDKAHFAQRAQKLISRAKISAENIKKMK